METIMIPVVVMGLTGIAMGLFLAFASKKFEVEVDPKIEEIIAILPGINCGACGCPGCAGYASAVVEDGASMTLCTPGGPKVMEKIGNIMGVAVEAPVKKKPVKKAKKKPVVAVAAVAAEQISASKEFIEKNKKMLVGYKEAFDNGDKEKQEKLEKLATMAKKEELLKCYEEIRAGKVIEAPAGAVAVSPISASKEFIEKNKKMLVGYKEAFDNGDKEKQEKLEKLATMTKKEELLKCYEEIRAGKVIEAPAGTTAVVAPTPISAGKEFIEKNKKMLLGYKEAIDGGDKEKQEKLEKLATMAKKEELLKCYEEIKSGKIIPNPETMPETKKEENQKKIVKEEIKVKEEKKENAKKEIKDKKEEVVKEEKQKEKLEEVKEVVQEEQVSASSNIYKYAENVPKLQEQLEPIENLEEKKEIVKEEPKTKEEQQSADYCNVLGDGYCVPELQEQMKEQSPLTEILEEKKVETPKTEEEIKKEEQAADYCNVLGDGYCVPEVQETVHGKSNLSDKLTENMD